MLKKLFDKLWPFAIFVLVSMILLPTSLIYQVSPIGDINTMLAMGNGLTHGIIPFIDIFEQRGPYMYVLHMVASLPGKSLHWVYLLEIINFYIIYRILHQIVRLKYQGRYENLIAIAPLIFYMISPSIWYGASPEEFTIIPVIYTVFIFLKYIMVTQEIPKKNLFLLGLGLSYILFLKYSIIGATVGLFIGYGLWLLWQRKFADFIKTVSISVAGFITGALPVVLLYASQGKLFQFFHQYFIENAGASSRKLLNILQQMGMALIFDYGFVFVIILLSLPFIIAFIKELKQKNKHIIIIGVSIFVFENLTMIAIMRHLPTYITPVIITILAIIAYTTPEVIKSWQKYNMITKMSWVGGIFGPIVVMIALIPIQNNIFLHTDTAFWTTNANKLATDGAFAQGQIIKKNNGGNIMVYSNVARAVYEGANSYPTLKYFDQTTISYHSQPKSGDSQIAYMKNKQVDWVQVTSPVLMNAKSLTSKEITQYQNKKKHHIETAKSSTDSVSASIDVPIERPKVHPNDYIKIVQIKHDNNLAVMFNFPKVLTENYVLVDMQSIDGASVKYEKLNHKKVKANMDCLLFVKKEIAQKQNLKAIPIESIK